MMTIYWTLGPRLLIPPFSVSFIRFKHGLQIFSKSKEERNSMFSKLPRLPDSWKRLEAHYLSNVVEVSVHFIFIKVFI